MTSLDRYSFDEKDTLCMSPSISRRNCTLTCRKYLQNPLSNIIRCWWFWRTRILPSNMAFRWVIWPVLTESNLGTWRSRHFALPVIDFRGLWLVENRRALLRMLCLTSATNFMAIFVCKVSDNEDSKGISPLLETKITKENTSPCRHMALKVTKTVQRTFWPHIQWQQIWALSWWQLSMSLLPPLPNPNLWWELLWTSNSM